MCVVFNKSSGVQGWRKNCLPLTHLLTIFISMIFRLCSRSSIFEWKWFKNKRWISVFNSDALHFGRQNEFQYDAIRCAWGNTHTHTVLQSIISRSNLCIVGMVCYVSIFAVVKLSLMNQTSVLVDWYHRNIFVVHTMSNAQKRRSIKGYSHKLSNFKSGIH